MDTEKELPVFKGWASEWFVRIAIFMVIMPSLGLFGLSTANGAAAAGYYGIEPADVQYSMVIFYAAVASFSALERRFFNFIAVKEYLLISSLVQILTSYICFSTHNLHMLFVFRFIQGMANCASTSICITLIFTKLHGERAREIGYSLFYCLLLCITPFTTLVTAPIVDAFDYNVLYKFIMYFYVPGTVFLFAMLNNVRLNKTFPLYQIDWASFIIYALALSLLGYILIYGQQYYWLEDKRILAAVIATVLLFALHIIRQLGLKRPYLDLSVFKYKNFVFGLLLIFVLYVCRGALGITTTYFAAVLGMDPIHVAYMLIANMAGIVISVLISSRLILMRRPMRFILIAGFGFMLIFHAWMRFLFDTQANASEFIIPLIVQGFGAGMLMAPLIIFTVSSVPTALGGTAASTGVFFRFAGFCASIGIVNYFSLYRQSDHFNRFQAGISDLDPGTVQRLGGYRQALIGKGMAPDQAARAANGLVARAVRNQALMRFSMDYYQMISWVILIIILLLAIYPYINRTQINVEDNQPSPASY
jgi:DHA2 family multidrug resistance protein